MGKLCLVTSDSEFCLFFCTVVFLTGWDWTVRSSDFRKLLFVRFGFVSPDHEIAGLSMKVVVFSGNPLQYAKQRVAVAIEQKTHMIFGFPSPP